MEIVFNKVGFIYHINSPFSKEALKDISISIHESKITSIIGRSGSGKTTLAELINALLYPTSGTLKTGKFLLDSNSKKIKDINELRINIGFVFQFPEEQFFCLTVKDEIEFGMKYFGYKTKDTNARIINALKMVGLNDTYMDRNPNTMSNGEKRKIAIASVLAFNPKVIILDEPTVGLDSSSKANLVRMIKRLKQRFNKTIILISHDTELVHQISDEVIVLAQGKIVLSGSKYEVFKEEEKLKEYGIKVPIMIEFANKVLKEKGIKLGYRDEINDLIKDVYRYAR